MDKQLFKLLVQLNTIATIVVAITSGVMAALDKSELRNPDVEANTRDNDRRIRKVEEDLKNENPKADVSLGGPMRR